MARKFFTDLYSREEANVIAFGVPLGKDSLSALDAIRETSWFVEPFDADKKKSLLQNVKIFDEGNLELGNLDEVTKKISEITAAGKIPLMFGGNHLSSLFSIPTLPKDTKVLVFDAHGDLKNEYDDEKIRDMNGNFFDKKTNDATWLRRLVEKIDPKNIFLIGLRSFDEDELNFLQANKINFVSARSAKDKMHEIKTALWHWTTDSNIYISLDIDVFDPSIAPAVDYPEPDGLLFDHFKSVVGDINGKIVGIDTCCLNPIAGNQVTEFLAVRSIFEILNLIK